MQNNFNDTVNQLKDFNLNPSEQVWKEVESNLDEKKKRRIVAWWWSMPVILLVGIAFYGYYGKSNAETPLKNAINTKSNTAENSLVNSNTNTTSSLSNKLSLKSNSMSSLRNKLSLKSNPMSSLRNKLSLKSNLMSSLSNKLSLKSNSMSSLSNKLSLKSNSISSLSNKMSSKSNSMSSFSSLLTLKKYSTSSLSDSMNTINADAVQDEFHTTKNLVQNTDINTLLKPKKNESINKFVDTTSKKTITKKYIKKRSLSWSLAVGGGANYVSRNNVFGKTNESSLYNSGLSSIPTTTSSVATTNALSLPTTGYCISLGVNVEKQLTKKVSLQSGLLYRFLDNRINFDNTSTASFLSSAANKDYKNNLHLFELPVNLKYCINPNSKNTISLLAGGNVSVAFKKHWLFINDDSHQYEEKSTEVNTVLFGLQTGISINFNNKFSLSLLAQKNITSVQKPSSKYYLQQINFHLNIPFKSLKK